MNFADEYMGDGPRPSGQPRWRGRGRGPSRARGVGCRGDVRVRLGVRRRTSGAVTRLCPWSSEWTKRPSSSVPSGPDLRHRHGLRPASHRYHRRARTRVALVTASTLHPRRRRSPARARAPAHTARRPRSRSGGSIGLQPPHGGTSRGAIWRGASSRPGAAVHYYPDGTGPRQGDAVSDDAFAFVGSPNFDMRSLYLNYENALCVFIRRAPSGEHPRLRGRVDQPVHRRQRSSACASGRHSSSSRASSRRSCRRLRLSAVGETCGPGGTKAEPHRSDGDQE